MTDQVKYNQKLKGKRVLIIGGSAGEHNDKAAEQRVRLTQNEGLDMAQPKLSWRTAAQ